MAKQIGKRERSRGKSGAGTFFLGIFLGIILGIGAVAGIGAFAYFKVSPNWINKTFKTDIDLGYDELNKSTVSDLISHATHLAKNIDTYSMNDLEKDFGVKVDDNISGIDITDLKDVGFTKLQSAIEDKFKNISAEELKNVVDLSSIENILNDKNTYYINGDKLYFDEAKTELVENFKYEVEETNGVTKVKVKKATFDLESDGTVKIELKYLPLTVAMSDFTNNLGENLTVGELRTEYKVNLPAYFDNEWTINEISSKINDIEIYKILELKKSGNKYYKDENNNNIMDANEVSNVLNAVAETKIGQMSSKIKSLSVGDLFDSTERTGVLSLIPATTTVDQIPTELQNVINNRDLRDLAGAGVVTIDETTLNKEIKVGGIAITGYETKTFGDLKVDEAVDIFGTLLDD
ncbi:MAG: hypothetical protein E7374_03775 [Clostridiales bacterium]|nr:hypothetical protein [Clostridiales bacterium]